MKQKAQIIPSVQLEELKLNELIGREVTIVEPQYSEKQKAVIGYWVELSTAYLGETQWFVPSNSIFWS